jgi:hypothetical protein
MANVIGMPLAAATKAHHLGQDPGLAVIAEVHELHQRGVTNAEAVVGVGRAHQITGGNNKNPLGALQGDQDEASANRIQP